MRRLVMVLALLLGGMGPADAQLSIGIGLPGVSIGINLPLFPQLVRVPNYPVYYAPALQSNYFFFDGMYWVYEGDNWYASTWYNGPWWLVSPDWVPLFVLRIPVRYYRSPPAYFRGWRPDAPPRWGEHWGHDWARQRSGWDRWNRNATPAPAPLPVYQRRYAGQQYPQAAQQPMLRSQNYRYRPVEPIVRQHFQQQAVPQAPAPVRPREQKPAPQANPPRPPDVPRPGMPIRGREDAPRPAPPSPPPGPPRSPPAQAQRKPPQQTAPAHEQPAPRAGQRDGQPDRGGPQAQGQGHGRGQGQTKGDERGQSRNQP